MVLLSVLFVVTLLCFSPDSLPVDAALHPLFGIQRCDHLGDPRWGDWQIPHSSFRHCETSYWTTGALFWHI